MQRMRLKYRHVVQPRVSERSTFYFQGTEENDNVFHLCWRMSITFWIIRSRDQKAQDYFKEPMKRVISPIRQQGTKICPGRAQIVINGSIKIEI